MTWFLEVGPRLVLQGQFVLFPTKIPEPLLSYVTHEPTTQNNSLPLL